MILIFLACGPQACGLENFEKFPCDSVDAGALDESQAKAKRFRYIRHTLPAPVLSAPGSRTYMR